MDHIYDLLKIKQTKILPKSNKAQKQLAKRSQNQTSKHRVIPIFQQNEDEMEMKTTTEFNSPQSQ